MPTTVERTSKRLASKKTTELILPTDAELDLMDPPTVRPLSMFERLCLGSTTDKPRSFEKARMDMSTFFNLTGNGSIELHYWIGQKMVMTRKRKRQRDEDEWDWTQDT